MLQVPSVDTMQGPIGFTGVHSFLNNLHSWGYSLPTITRWHEHPGGISVDFSIFISNFLSASNSLYFSTT